MLSHRYSCSIDMWSLGCILVEMLTGKPLFEGQKELGQVKRHTELLGLPPLAMLEGNAAAAAYFEKDEEGRWGPSPAIQPLEVRRLTSLAPHLC
jgi:serine/threonine protein kinase